MLLRESEAYSTYEAYRHSLSPVLCSYMGFQKVMHACEQVWCPIFLSLKSEESVKW